MDGVLSDTEWIYVEKILEVQQLIIMTESCISVTGS